MKTDKTSLEQTITNLEKEYGTGAVMYLGQCPDTSTDVISTGIISLDIALGIGGIPGGRIIEIYGPESSGKTTLALHCIAAAQKSNKRCAFVDSEHALDASHAQGIGVNIKDLLISQPNSGEEALDIVEKLAETGQVDLIIIDSVAAMVPKAEVEGSITDQIPGLQARLMSKGLRRLTSIIHRTNTSLIFINQIRTKIGVFFGNPETTSGGKALKFYASIRIEIRSGLKMNENGVPTGIEAKIKVVKNKLAPPFRTANVLIIYGHGISPLDDLIKVALQAEIISKSGSWLQYKDQKLGQGQQQAKQFLQADTKLVESLKKDILDNYSLK